ncbi:hypothetical protein M9434_005167 [Picochlorum sp. BPE23]|nr:hypothetical protein M9434_005167 [Picochlorum sp. BPE23]KAI8101312.1 hypothetical protein M9435_001420 [Picochlorum sp. BPE23]
MKAVMMERTVSKVTCGVTSVSHRGVHHRVARSSMGIEKLLINGVRQGRMVSMQAKKAPELPPVVSPTQGEPEWYALVARAEFFFNDVQNEALAEQLRELKRYYEENGREQDFFFVCEPEWLDKFPEAKSVKKPAVALVSTDKEWMVFMKLRLDRVLKLDLGNMSIDAATKSTAKVPEFEPQEWNAPYTPYSKGWWEVFMR